MRIGIIGSGALGSLFAAYLSPHVEIILIGHWEKQIDILIKRGLTVINFNRKSSQYYFPTTNNPLNKPKVDAALILVKSYQTIRAARETNILLNSQGVAITLQNGLGNFETLTQTLGPNRVIQGVTSLGAKILEPGVVHYAGEGMTYLARSTPKQNTLKSIVRLFNRSGFQTEVSHSLDGLVWGKLVVNSAINPLTALLNVRNGFIVSNKLARKLAVGAAEETASVAKALGIPLPFRSAGERALEVAQATADNHSSMLQDVRRNAPTEINSICGQVVKNGQSGHINTPINKEFLRLVTEYSHGVNPENLRSNIGSLQKLLRNVWS